MAVYKSDCSSSWNVYSNKATKGKVLPTAYPLRIATIAGSYKDLLHLGNDNLGISASLRNIYDGIGNPSRLKVSNQKVDIDTNGGTISDPILGSNFTFFKKIELSDLIQDYSADLKDSCGILLHYDNMSSSSDIIANLNMQSDNLFSTMPSSFDEGMAAEVSLCVFKNSNQSIIINLNCSYNESFKENPLIIEIPSVPSFSVRIIKILITISTFPNTQIDLIELTNA